MDERLFPKLTDAQIGRIAAHGRRRVVARGEVLVEVGQKVVPFFVVVDGELQVLRPAGGGGTLVVTHRHGQFWGEGNMVTGPPSLSGLRVSGPGEGVDLDGEELLALIASDAE